MKRDFTLVMYEKLLKTFLDSGYTIMPYSAYCKGKCDKKMLILRHDVDKRPQNSLDTANIEFDLGINSSYYFRKKYFTKKNIILKIFNMGNEIGYHYEDLVINKGNEEMAYQSFNENLSDLRKMVPVETIVMHGSPLYNIDNRDLWQHYDYSSLGILGEPYIDVNYNDIFYITDTGRSWNGISRRDFVKRTSLADNIYFSTLEIISALKNDSFPNRVMITTHPQRWTNNLFLWVEELVFQNIKNIIKQLLITFYRK